MENAMMEMEVKTRMENSQVQTFQCRISGIPKPKRFRVQGDGHANPLQRGLWSGEIKHRNF
ncbi:hypothetical protein TIFTF001_013018 [Ficus carica]|uniref:Uncharacterized protein n=1 Tax=Ficus carica TaxID=3494 RepID=A0AA88ADF0_FICCA|nr:hypothetical protein TIFTF001_013018 [Ficus carica]